MGEQYRGFKSERVQRSYYCINGHVQEPMFAAHIDPTEIPDMIDCPNCGMPAGQDKKNPPETAKHEPYKTHLAYVKERRTADEAKSLLDEALTSIRERRVKLAQEAAKQAKLAAAKAAAAKVAAAKAAAAKAVKPKLVKKTEKLVSKKPASKKSPVKPIAKTKAKSAPKVASKAKAAAKVTKKASKPLAKSAPKAATKKAAKK
jgi:Tfp pilus assembly protein FimV